MTLNQLKYWELRWKQFYDMRQLEVDKEKLALEAAKLAETIRHNKVSERQETQRIVNERRKISLEWSKLDETIRSNIVNEGIKAFQATESQRHNLTTEQQNYIKILGDQAVALGDLMVQAEDSKNKNTVEFIKAYGDNVGEFLKAFGGGAASTAVAELRAGLGAANYDAIVQSVIDQFPQFKDVIQTEGVAGAQYKGKTGHQFYDETYGPQARQRLEHDMANVNVGKKDEKPVENRYPHDREGSGLVIGQTGTQGAPYYNSNGNSDENKSPQSNIVFSEIGHSGSHTTGGTDYKISGGLKSSGIIYS